MIHSVFVWVVSSKGPPNVVPFNDKQVVLRTYPNTGIHENEIHLSFCQNVKFTQNLQLYLINKQDKREVDFFLWNIS